MKHLKKFNENNQDLNGKECKSCIKGIYKETSLMDDLKGVLHCSECGAKVNRYLSNDDFPTKPGFVERRMRQQKEFESKYQVSFPVPVSAYELLKSKGVSDSKIVEAYQQYVNHALGLTYGTDLEEFRAWCNESDNLVDFQS